MAGVDAMRERIAAHPWPCGGVEVIRANRGYTLYSRRTGDPVASGHLETEFLAHAPSEDEARRTVGSLTLNDVKAHLDRLILAKKADLVPWWESMRQEGKA